MYRAYDRHLYDRPADTPTVGTPTVGTPTAGTPTAAKVVPLSRDQLNPRVVVHPLLFCPPLAQGARYVLVKRDWPGVRNVLGVGHAISVHETKFGRRETEGGSAWGKRGPHSSHALALSDR